MDIEDTDLSNAAVGLFYRLRKRNPERDSIAAEALATDRPGERPGSIRALLDDIEEAGYLRRWTEGRGPGAGTRRAWRCYPNGDAPKAVTR